MSQEYLSFIIYQINFLTIETEEGCQCFDENHIKSLGRQIKFCRGWPILVFSPIVLKKTVSLSENEGDVERCLGLNISCRYKSLKAKIPSSVSLNNIESESFVFLKERIFFK